jgi:signal transduction histidine kinase
VIEDDGPGIDISFLPRAFEKFEKDSRSSGTGLGLYVARKMAEALDASILVSTSAAGTTFAVAVPVTAGAEAAA